MKALEIGLHATSLACCVALGAGVWTLASRPAPVAPVPAPPVSAAELTALKEALHEVPALRREVAELREMRALPETSQPRPVPAAPTPANPAPAAASVQAALADPAVQQKVKELVETQLKADREIRRQEDADRRQEDAKRWSDRRVDGLAKDLSLNEAQKGELGKEMDNLTQRYDDLRARTRAKELTPEQAKAEMERTYAESDLRLQSTLSADQFSQYLEKVQPGRQRILNNGFPQSSVGVRRGGRTPSRE